MEKGAFLPIRFYPATSWTDYEKLKGYGGDVILLKDHNIFPPAFQFGLPDGGRHWGSPDFFPWGIDIVNYDTGTVTILSGLIDKVPLMYTQAGVFRSLVYARFPLSSSAGIERLPAGKYYYHMHDERFAGLDNGEWFSEVFELCDLGLDAMTAEFANDANWANFASSYDDGREKTTTQFCKSATGAGDATAYMDIETFAGEEFDVYIVTDANTSHGGCAIAQWNDSIFLEFREPTWGAPVSETIEISVTDTHYTFSFTSEMSGTVRLYMYALDAITTKGEFEITVQRRYTDDHVQLRYSNSTNFCKIFYENDYENIFFLDAKQVIDENPIEETVVEDDETNKYRIIGTNKRWNSVQFASGEAMLNAMSLLRLHDNIKIIKETGEPMTVVEMLIEQTVLDYEASQIKLIYREDSCSVEACGFEPCCPTVSIPTMEDVYDAPGSLPAAGASNNRAAAMVLTAGDQYRIYISDGAAWAVSTAYDIADNCAEARQNNHTNGNRFFWYDSGVSRWRIFIELATVADATGGIATLTTDTEYRDDITVRGEYYDATEEEWTACTEPTLLVAGGGAIALSCESGAGAGINFRLHIYTDDCDYGYSNEVTQTIT